jgi:hypothetical protein
VLPADFPSDVVYFEALEIGQPHETVLRVVIGEGIVRAEADEIHGELKLRASPITVGLDSRIFEFLWDDFVAYAMTLESYHLPEAEKPVVQQGIFREFSQSRYLTDLRAATFAEAVHRKVMRHWQLATLNHIIDVAGWKPPEVRQLHGYRLPDSDISEIKH